MSLILVGTRKYSVFELVPDVLPPSARPIPRTLREAALNVLNESNLEYKAELTFLYEEQWKNNTINVVFDDASQQLPISDSPSRPPKADSFKTAHKNAIEVSIHGIAHAESYAIDLFWDGIARYSHCNLPREFYDDFVHIAGQEAKHFLSWFHRLQDTEYPYGSLVTHEGLWRSALETKDNLLARLAVINMLHEARGLDTSPLSLERFKKVRDEVSEKILLRNYTEEIHHVATGLKWFKFICERDWEAISKSFNIKSSGSVGSDSDKPSLEDMQRAFQHIVRTYHKGYVKGPFNAEGRGAAGLTEDWYMPLTDPALAAAQQQQGQGEEKEKKQKGQKK